MFAKALLNFRKHLHTHGITFCYSGFMSDDLLLGIGKMLRKKIASTSNQQKVKTVFSVFVEQMQALLSISAEREGYDEGTTFRYGVIAMGETGDHTFLAFGNIIHLMDAIPLIRQLEIIKNSDKAGLRALWKRALKDAIPGEHKIDWSGFINIARRATGGFEYEIVKIDPRWAFFTFKAFI